MTRSLVKREEVGLTVGNWIAIVTLIVTATIAIVSAVVYAAYTVTSDLGEFRMQVTAEMSSVGTTLGHHSEQMKRMQNRIDDLAK